jgi:hypothetical protein
MHIVYNSPRGILLILALIFAILSMIPWAPAAGQPAPRWANWMGLSWVFFVAAFVFGA